MADIDAIAPNYHRAQQRWPDAPTLLQGFDSLNDCFTGNTHGLVEHVKSFVESVCLTIMGEFREPMPSAQPSMTDLLVTTLSLLGLKNTRGATKLDKILSGFNKLSDAITDMRNETGPIAHGKDGFLDAITSDHACAYLHVGDAILGILLNAYDGKQPDLIATREPYERFSHLNERIDQGVTMRIRIEEDNDRPVLIFSIIQDSLNEDIELRIEPSRLLYGIDREAYVEILKNVQIPSLEDEELIEEVTESIATEPLGTSIHSEEGSILELMTEYKGGLEDLRGGLYAFLQAEGVDPNIVDIDGMKLIDSLLATAEKNMALDWKQREGIKAKLKIGLKRVYVRFGITSDKSDAVAERLVSWLMVQALDNASLVPGQVTPDQGANV